ncbi:ZIP family metal transporter [Pacificimonas flava]|uniref:Zinc transporter n=1 Tax=Pacificimonas flava TaxID=1234595 RepID=M2SDN7_9SPHN|nr:hypothetical protein [Pacificimonas flava]EMD83480.1 hypothetical protein C725_1381 [Pacificimonas flava]MBB5278964.1 ZIP family zinc transporter [Pacificimonas flava]
MMMTLLVVGIVSGALLVGAGWGLYGRLPKRLEGFLVALAGGALIVSVMSELIQPAQQELSLLMVVFSVGGGALVFTGLDYLVDEKMKSSKGSGLLLAITLDGIPENLALGVALIGAGPTEVAALAGSILLSNLPEAAGGAKQMTKGGHSRTAALALWAATAALLSAAAVAGNLLLKDASADSLAHIRCFAAGAVVASLATEVFPEAYREDRNETGIAVALGLLMALALGTLPGG